MAEENKNPLTPISDLGEFGLIKHITKHFTIEDPQVVKGIGDDAAVVRQEPDQVQVFTTDMLLENVHFDLSYMPLKHLGYKAVAVNLSDIFAMNAEPYGVTISLGLSSRFPVEAVEELYKGIGLACEKYGVTLLGGDTTSSRQGLVIAVSAYGHGKEEELVYRKGAQKGDLICVSGDLGGAYAGLLVLDREKAAFEGADNEVFQPQLDDYEYVIGRQLKPEARGDIIKRLNKAKLKATSMIDISDGLASELHHICEQSECGATIYTDKIPVDFITQKVADEFKISSATFALSGGEDYEMLFTIPLEDFTRVTKIQDVMVIGHITEDKGVIQAVLADGSVTDIQAQGWNHFKVKDN